LRLSTSNKVYDDDDDDDELGGGGAGAPPGRELKICEGLI